MVRVLWPFRLTFGVRHDKSLGIRVGLRGHTKVLPGHRPGLAWSKPLVWQGGSVTMSYAYLFKCRESSLVFSTMRYIIIGDTAVGKSCLLLQFTVRSSCEISWS